MAGASGIERPAAEGDHPAAAIADRKHHPVAKPVISDGNVITSDHQPGFGHLLDCYTLFSQMAAKCRPVIGGIAKAEFLLDGPGEIAVSQIAPGPRAPRRLQFSEEKVLREFHHFIEACALFLALYVSLRNLRHRQSGLLRQPLHRFRKAHALAFSTRKVKISPETLQPKQ